MMSIFKSVWTMVSIILQVYIYIFLQRKYILVHIHGVPKYHSWVHFDVLTIILRSTKESFFVY